MKILKNQVNHNTQKCFFVFENIAGTICRISYKYELLETVQDFYNSNASRAQVIFDFLVILFQNP